MNGAAFGDQILISAVSWIIGVVLGGGLGYGCALGASRFLKTSTGSRRYAFLLPWRTIVISLPMLLPVMPVLVGLGRLAGILMASLVVFVLAVVFTITTLLEVWLPTSTAVRLVSGTRSIAVATPIIVVYVSFLGGGGLGNLIWQGEPRMEPLASSMVILLALLFDLVLGFVQIIIYQSGHNSDRARNA